MIENIKQASDHLRAVAKDLRRHPWRLIHKPDAAESKEAHVFDAVREFAEASAKLDDTLGRLQALLASRPGGDSRQDPTLLAMRDKLKNSLEQFRAAEEALWSQLDVR